MEHIFEGHADTRMLISDWLKRNKRRPIWLSDQTGISQSYLSKVLRQQRKLSQTNLDRINEVIGTDFKMTVIEPPKH